MSLNRYFKSVAKNLPDPEGPLSDVLPSSTIKGVLYSLLKASQVTWQNRVIFYVDGNIMVVN